MTAYLCVGGPFAGEWRELPEGHDCFHVAVRPPYDIHRMQRFSDIVEVETIEYHLVTFITGNRSLRIWTPRGQTPFRTMELLLETYENPWMDRHGQAATPRRT